MARLFLIVFFALNVSAEAVTSRDPQVVLPQLRAWHEHGSFARLEAILGKPDEEMISGFSITTFSLADGSSIYVKSTPSHNRIYTIDRRAPGQLAVTLYEPLVPDLDHPLPASRPF